MRLKMILSMLIFGSVGVFVKYINLPSGFVALVRGIIGTLLLLFIAFIYKKKPSAKAIKKNLLLLIISGIALGANWICLFEAYKNTSISIATLCYYMAPIIVILISPFLFKERLNFAKTVCIILSLVGIVLVSEVFSGFNNSKNQLLGIMFALSAAIFYACVITINKFIINMKASDRTFSQLAIASFVIVPYTFCFEIVDYNKIDFKTVMLLLIIGIVHTGIAYSLYLSAVGELSAQQTSFLSFLDPISSVILSFLIFNDKMDLLQITGAILLLGAILISGLIDNYQSNKSGIQTNL